MTKIIGLYRERLKGISTADVISLQSNRVPHNFILLITRFAIYNGDGADRDFEICLCGHGYEHIIDNVVNIGAGNYRTLRTMIMLGENEYLTVRFSGLAADKIMEAHLTGQWFREEDVLIKAK